MPEQAFDRPMVVSSDQNPEEAARLAQDILDEANEEKGPKTIEVPFIEPPPDTVVRLPGGGLMDSDGTLHDEAVVKELTGSDEEALSKAEVTKTLGRYIQVLVRRGTESIGAYQHPDDKLLGELLIGDREALILAIRRATYGDELKLTVVCPSCTSAVDVTYDLATEIPITEMEDKYKRDIGVKLRDGRHALFRIPTCADQDALYATQNKTMSEMNSVLMSRCLISIDGQPVQGRNAVLALGIRDRKKIVAALNGAQPGPKYNEIDIECPSCGAESPLQVRLLDLFRG